MKIDQHTRRVYCVNHKRSSRNDEKKTEKLFSIETKNKFHAHNHVICQLQKKNFISLYFICEKAHPHSLSYYDGSKISTMALT